MRTADSDNQVRSRLRGVAGATHEWLSGDRERAPVIWLEKQVFLLRWLGIVLIVPVLLLLPLPVSERRALLAIVGFAIVYNSAVPFLIRRRPDRVMLLTISADACAAGLFIFIAGFDTPLYMVLFTIVVACSLRVGLRLSLLVVLLLVVLDTVSSLGRPGQSLGTLLLRSGFLALVAILAAILYDYAKRGEGRLRRLNEQLATANADLRQLDQIKNAFVSNVSHELRTPLTAIRAYSELLLSYDDPVVSREFAEIINGESERLTRLVDDVLDLMKIEAGKITWHFQPVDLAATLDGVSRVYGPLIARGQLDFACTIARDLPPVAADVDRVRQVLGNLLGNALKFTSSGTIGLDARPVGDEIYVSVSDTGIGVAPEDQGRIFERFQQVGALLTDKPGGSGLGLAISRRIVERHGGRIWVSSYPGQGSTFTFSLPIARSGLSSSVRPDLRPVEASRYDLGQEASVAAGPGGAEPSATPLASVR